MKISSNSVVLALLAYAVPSIAYSSNNKNVNANPDVSRRNVLANAGATAMLLGGLGSNGRMALAEESVVVAAEEDTLTPLYFGVGCFWHIQHEFIEGERSILGRNDHQLTSATGYAGGKATDKEGRVCYHNLQGVADYGKLGHSEVVGMNIPQSKIKDFSALYFSLYNPKTKDRVDPGDRGGEYRSLLGLPGGTSHTSYPLVQAEAEKAGFKLVDGKGNDPDTLGKQIVYVHDTKNFPFYQAEVYHQYHNDFQSPAYGKDYNLLAELALDEGRIKGTGCPDRI